MFFTEDDVPTEFDESKIKKFLSEHKFEDYGSMELNWILKMKDCEALVVENPSTPECIPMIIDSGSFRRTGVKNHIDYEFKGFTSFYSFTYHKVLLQHTLTNSISRILNNSAAIY